MNLDKHVTNKILQYSVDYKNKNSIQTNHDKIDSQSDSIIHVWITVKSSKSINYISQHKIETHHKRSCMKLLTTIENSGILYLITDQSSTTNI